MSVLEKEIESYLIRKVELCGGMCLKYPTIHTEGIPDRIVLLPGGRVIFVELKRPKGGELREVQKYQIAKLRAIGINVQVINTKAGVDDLLAKAASPLPTCCPRDEAECPFFDNSRGCTMPNGSCVRS